MEWSGVGRGDWGLGEGKREFVGVWGEACVFVRCIYLVGGGGGDDNDNG